MTPEKIWIGFATLNPDESQRPDNARIRVWTADPERAKHFREKEGLAMFEFNLVENPADSLASIASSLKIIANEIRGDPEHLGLISGIMHAIEQGFIAGRNG